jgi:hypothetical protein
LGDEEEEAEEGGDLNLGAQAKRAAKHVTRHARTWSHATCRRGNWVPSAVAAIKDGHLTDRWGRSCRGLIYFFMEK